MVTTARIFGDQVGSTAPVFLAFLAGHVLAGSPQWSPALPPR
jgi:hypothetical protein